jgi:hypothetical protein
MPATARTRLPTRTDGARALAVRGFYVALVTLMTGMVLAGFWPYYAGLARGTMQAHWLIHLHAAVFTGWMVLLLAQAMLVFRRRVGTHQRLGRIGIAYGALVLLLGAVIAIAAPAMSVVDGRSTPDEAAAFLILPAVDMLLFAGFFTAAIAYRKRRELHKRLILLATVALLFAPAARIAWEGGPLSILLVWLLPLWLAMGYDFAILRRVERVYFVGLAVFLVAFARIGLMETQAWLDIGRGILGLVLPEVAT